MPAPYELFLLFGDSITQESFSQERGFGFSAALQNAYIRRLDIVNRGFSGYNTRQALKILPAIVPPPDQARIRFMAVFFGANDASLPDAPNKQHIPLDEFKANLKAIVSHPQIKAHGPRIILVAPAPINEHLWWPRDASNGYTSVTRLAATTKVYADAVAELGTELKLPVVNLWEAFMAKTDFKLCAWKLGDALPGSLEIAQSDALVELMYDGLHFSPAGYEILYQEFIKVISAQWPDQIPEKLAMVLPAWNDEAAWEEA
ncbi:GDSL Lipase Acylhydrolase family protein [Pyrenophora tritici-repentis]|nr:GDSL Lipase/Acylhydrolase family protein [Pyrenophora tritici-repentis]KAI0589015.1 GDSL Lipase/Acylhydrolase family protein [Pyrenophora tritici-repentis]KAI0612616.1 GDSL Lipase/Acylhydrolase family protein [Pyrenophora tritici-repentis]KAI0624782.1 GDSL Lipase/Acylhydrolase family protein [Pyrenophora tritici-repentis]KAI1511967.1 GDSL Lipase/Acylhydrolase family protein [Pyrenophora tritici-repentis]